MMISSSNAQFTAGQTLTAGQLNSQFALYLPTSGGTLTGPLVVPALSSANATISGGTIAGLSAPIPFASGGTNASTATGATSALQYVQGAAGSVSRSLTSKFQDGLNVKDFGAKCDGSTDDSAAFQAAVNATGSTGTVSADGACVVNTAPTLGTKNIFWNFGPDIAITGTQTTFPRMFSNQGVPAVGPWIQSRSAVVAPTGDAYSAFSVETLPPSTLAGGVISIYAGTNLTGNGTGSIATAQNLVATAQNGSSGNIWGQEIDVGMFAPTGTGTQFGLSLNGLGTGNPTFGVKLDRADTSKWQFGLDVRNAVVGLNIENTTGMNNAIVAGSIPTMYAGTTAMIGQMANSGSALILQRYTNTSPAGYLLSAINANNTAQLFSVDVSGNVNTSATYTSTSSANAFVAGTLSSVFSGNTLDVGQTANGGGVLLMQRYTNTSPTGYFISAINATNTGQLFSVDVSGNVNAAGSVSHSQQEIDKSYTYNTPATGTTITMTTGTETAVLNPAGTLAALTLTLPACTSAYDASIARYSSTQTITALTLSATSGSVSNAPTTLAAGAGHGMICRGANTTWYPLY